MNHIAIALFMLLPAFSPVPWRASASSGPSGGNIQKNGNQHKNNSPTPSPSLPLIESVSPDHHRQQVTCNDCHHGIELTRIPPITIIKDKKGFWDHVFDWGPWVFTGLLVIVGFLQVGALAWQICVFNKTLREIHFQALEMRGQKMTMRETLEAIKDQGRIMERQTTVTEKELVLVQRPRIEVRNFIFSEPKSARPDIVPPWGIKEGSECIGQYYIVNFGGTDAHITEIHSAEVFIIPTLPMKRPYEDTVGTTIPITLKPGESVKWGFAFKGRLDAATALNINRSTISFFYVLGKIRYVDDLGIYRDTAFCRKYDPRAQRLIPVIDPDYEYRD